MVNARIEIEFTNYKQPVENRNWVETFMDKVIMPRFNVTSETFKKIGDEVKKQQELNLTHSRGFDGRSLAPKLRPSKYGGKKLFFDTGELYRSVFMKYSKDYTEIFVGGNRKDIGYWLATGTKQMVARPWFGLSNDLKQKIYEILKQKIYG